MILVLFIPICLIRSPKEAAVTLWEAPYLDRARSLNP